MSRGLTSSVRGKLVFRRNKRRSIFLLPLRNSFFFQISPRDREARRSLSSFATTLYYGFSVCSISVLPRSNVKCCPVITQIFSCHVSLYVFSFSLFFFFLFIFLHALIYTYTDNVERELTILRTMETARDAHDDRSYCSKV